MAILKTAISSSFAYLQFIIDSRALKLSIVIVNYNVQHFLEQCLQSVMEAVKQIDAEIFVVDNNSVDGSVAMVEVKFPTVKLIANKENTGFSKANNQAMEVASGQYVLLLNPDTLVETDTFTKVIGFMDAHPEAGGLGIKMVDGKGNFLPESKRSLPTPEVAFYKIFGLSWLFPGSKRFGKYHLTYLNKEKTHEIEVLSGAFMLMRKKTLDKVGLLDEDFFMYGEDIDLSYRIIKGGYKNYYFPEARIIHYKGESTKKGSLNYVYVFYNAMAIFARKHFSKERAQLFSLLINFAILLRATVSLVGRFVKRASLPILDGALIYTGLYFISRYWETTIKATQGLHYPQEFFLLALPVYVLVWLVSMYYSGGYDRPIRILNIIRGLMAGSVIILIGYGLMDETARFSRATIVLGSLWSLFIIPAVRLLFHTLKLDGFDLNTAKTKRFLVVGKNTEAQRVKQLIRDTFSTPEYIGNYNISEDKTLSRLDEFIRIHKVGEVIFCAKDIPAQQIIDLMTQTKYPQVDFKIAPIESMFLIGSNTINTAGDLYAFGMNAVNKATNKRMKRLVDVLLALVFVTLLPIILWFMRQPFGLIKNIFLVFFGKRTRVGYIKDLNADQNFRLPKLPKAVLNPADGLEEGNPDHQGLLQLNMMYAKDYRVSNDLNIILKGFRRLGR
ncbi:MAG: glycosyltransferase [Flavobacteriales bacterium]|nr:glycosyltransferase [Flavobacteriales bacterium]